MVKEGQKAPAFNLHDSHGKEYRLENFKGKKVVLYFYPKDNTPGCTIEALDFTRLKSEFEKNNTVIIGISRDSCASHQRFIEKQNLTILLLSDDALQVQKLYNVWRPKVFMGKEYLGTVRSTFLIDKEGKIVKIWDGVTAKGHAEEVLREVKRI